MPRTFIRRGRIDTHSTGIGSFPLQKRVAIEKVYEDSEIQGSDKRLKDIEICVPVVYGTRSFWLGKKARETQSHMWTVYVRGSKNEDLGAVIRRVKFTLHPSFADPVRVVESPPFELTECGWGEFEILISIFFHGYASDKQLDLYHHLKLYADEESGPRSTKKPVVMESYDEIIFPDPLEDFFSRVLSHPSVLISGLPDTFDSPPEPLQGDNDKKKGDAKENQQCQWYTNFSEKDELLKLAAARQEVQAQIVKLRAALGILDGLPQSL